MQIKDAVMETVRVVTQQHFDFEFEFNLKMWVIGIEWQFRTRGWDIYIHPFVLIGFYIHNDY